MDNKNFNINSWQAPAAGSTTTVARSFISGVFAWMGIALGISSLTAYVFGTEMSYMSYLINTQSGGLSGFGYVVMFAPIGFVLLMSFGFHKLSSTALTAIFMVYSVLMGMSLSFIFLVYTLGSIFGVFMTCAAMFGVMAVMGYTTKTDLTKFGSIMMMALFGIIIASLINMFMHSSQMDYIISFVSVIVFTGLTAYDVQKLKNIGAGIEYGTESTAKLSILGALTLYLDFINLFLALLRLFGNRRD